MNSNNLENLSSINSDYFVFLNLKLFYKETNLQEN